MTRSATFRGLMAVIAGLSVATCGAAPSDGQDRGDDDDSPAVAEDQASPAPVPAGPVPPTVIGMNLARLLQYQSIWPFADLIQSNGKIFFPFEAESSPTDEGDGLVDPQGKVRFDATGHPIDVPAGTTIGLTIQMSSSPRNPTGVIKCTISPGWKIEARGITMTTHSPERFDLEFPNPDPSGGGGVLYMTPSGPKASLTTARCLLPGTTEKDVVNPGYLKEIKPFRIIRFMDWMRTNNAPPVTWAQRTLPSDFSQLALRGVSVEYMVSLANAAKSDPWFTLPFHADDDYYRRFAEYVRDHLDPDRRAYVELSNEVWNTKFEQTRDAIAAGMAEGLDPDQRFASERYYANRVRALMAIWSQVFAGQEKRLVRVISAQAVSAKASERMLSWKDTARSVDALAIAPYFSIAKPDPNISQDQLAAKVFGAEGLGRVDAAIETAAKQKAVASKYGLRLIAYEGGQHFTGRNALAEKYQTINTDQRMEILYRRYLEGWRTRIGDALVLYNDIGPPGRSGSWGHKFYTGQPLSQAPKMRAVMAELAKDEKQKR